MRSVLLILVNPSILSMIFLIMAVVWMLRDERDRTRPLLVIAMVLNMFYGFLLDFVMGKENGLIPWKYDYVLARLDAALGAPASAIAPALQGSAHWPLQITYWLMVPMMVVWFAVARRNGLTGALVLAYITEMLMGPTLYAVLPACGPRYAFGKQWLTPPVVAPGVIKLSGGPNAFPSLHLATALIFVFFSGGRISRFFALVFLAATAMATISTGEHYAIDLVAGLAFGCFAANVGRRRLKASLLWLAVVLAWSLSVRWASSFWIGHPDLLRIFAAITVVCAAGAVVLEWRSTPKNAAAPAQAPAGVAAEGAGAE
ncbi:MAG TPA: phosphatase PAP2 family protein [Terracidiphilus sp.]|nr:phosphatase PAP2 family protein [Terracidiphilus sp.]